MGLARDVARMLIRTPIILHQIQSNADVCLPDDCDGQTQPELYKDGRGPEGFGGHQSEQLTHCDDQSDQNPIHIFQRAN